MAKSTNRMTGRKVGENHKAGNMQMHTYVEGNTVRVADYAQQQEIRVQEQSQIRKNRERALSMNLSYVVFLAAAAVISVLVCVNFLKLQASYTAYQKTVTAKTSQLSQMKLENDIVYDGVISSVDLEHVRDVAMRRLGMVYASESQIVYYQNANNDYVKQYQEIPKE